MFDMLKAALIGLVMVSEVVFLVGTITAPANPDGDTSTAGVVGFWAVVGFGLPLILLLVGNGLFS